MEKYYKLPTEDVNDEEAIIVDIPHKSGEKITEGESLYSFETTKALIEIHAEQDGFVFYLVNLSDTIPVGSDVCVISSKKDFEIEKIKKEISSNIESSDYKLTKKAQTFVDENQLNLENYNLTGIIRLKKLQEMIKSKDPILDSKNEEKVLLINKTDDFITRLYIDDSIKYLTSEEKVALYRDNGHSIGENVIIGSGTLIISNSIDIKDNVTIGEDTYIEVPEIEISQHTQIGNNCNVVASKLILGSYNRLTDNARVDLSGGRNLDSNLITGRGCLMSSYINVCREVKLGENVALSPDSIIFTHSYWQSVLDGYPASYGPINFDDDSWLGAGSYVLPNVNIGKGSVIMSASLVVTDVKPFTMVGGTPAELIKDNLRKTKTQKQIYEQLFSLFRELYSWFDLNHYQVDDDGDYKFTVKTNEQVKKCGFIDGVQSNETHYDDCQIIISYNSTKQQYPNCRTLINIERKEIVGDYAEIETLITEFFRHRGIRIYHS